MKLDSHLAPSDQTLLDCFACLETDGGRAMSLGLLVAARERPVSGPYTLIHGSPLPEFLAQLVLV
jgi:hypothetical protein